METSKTRSVSKSSLGPQVNKLQTSEKCATFLSRRTILGVITVVFLNVQWKGQQIRTYSISPGLLCMRDGTQLLWPSLCKLDALDRRLSI